MKVLFVNGNPNKGGDSIKLFRFKKELEKLDVEVNFTRETEGDWSKYDIIHSFNFTQGWTKKAFENARKYKVPFVVSSIFFEHEYQDSYDEMVRHSYFIVYSSKEVNAIYRASKELPRNKIVTDGVDDEFYSNNKDRDIDFLFVGGVHELKKPLMVAKIAKELGKNCTIVGGDHFQKRYWQECKDAGAIMLGEVPHEKMPEIYARAKVVVQPSNFDAFPNTVLEGGLAGCTIILTKNTYCDLPIIYTTPEEPNLKRAMQYALEHPVNIQQLIKTNFNWNDKAKELKEYYEEIKNLIAGWCISK